MINVFSAPVHAETKSLSCYGRNFFGTVKCTGFVRLESEKMDTDVTCISRNGEIVNLGGQPGRGHWVYGHQQIGMQAFLDRRTESHNAEVYGFSDSTYIKVHKNPNAQSKIKNITLKCDLETKP